MEAGEGEGGDILAPVFRFMFASVQCTLYMYTSWVVNDWLWVFAFVYMSENVFSYSLVLTNPIQYAS